MVGEENSCRHLRFDQKNLCSFQLERKLQPIPNFDFQIAIVAFRILNCGELNLLVAAKIKNVSIISEEHPFSAIRATQNFSASLEVLTAGFHDQFVGIGALAQIQTHCRISSGNLSLVEDSDVTPLFSG